MESIALNKQQAIDTVQAFFKCLFSDFRAATGMIAEDFVWDNFLPPNVPFGRSYKGAEGLRAYLGELAAAWSIGDLVFRDYIYDPESRTMAVTGAEKNGKALPTGRSCDMDFVWEFRFGEDGKIRYLREYNDTFAIGRTFER